MRARRWCYAALFAAWFAAPLALGAQAQPFDKALQRAMDLENAAKYRDAAVAYREALSQGAVAAGVLGLERTLAAIGQEESFLPVVDSILRLQPREPAVRGALLRTLRSLGRDNAARKAYDDWRALDPKETAPYREYARLLMQDRRTAAADSVLRDAALARGGTKEFATEFAELYAGMGAWEQAATSWREAIVAESWLDQSAVFSLQPTPTDQRDKVRAVLGAAPKDASAEVRTALVKTRSGLELRWGSPRAAWTALSVLPPSDSTAQVWIDFADEAEHYHGALAVRDALAAAFAVRKEGALAVRAASSALIGGDYAGALTLATSATAALDSAKGVADALPIRVRALAELARPKEAEQLMTAYGARVTDVQRRLFQRSLAWGWIRAGDITKARKAAEQGGGEEEDVVSGWLALFAGDLDVARSGLRTAEEKNAEVVVALAFISRAKVKQAPTVGAAFLSLARGDSAAAAAQFEKVAADVPSATSFLLGVAARVANARKDDARALRLWQQLLSQFPESPEAPAADLEWASYLEAHGNRAAATERFEHLILTFPDSALVPQARAALERLRGTP